jgi:hypothetical protein
MNKSALLVIALPLALAACEAPADQQLESFGLQITSSDEADEGQPWFEMSAGGTATVTGAERDLTVTVTGADEETELAVHTPGMSDLSVVDGADVTVEIIGGSLVIGDEAGLVYVADDGGGRWRLEEDLGAGFVDYGATISEKLDGSDIYTYTTAVFQGDDGEVEIHPGDSDTVVIDGTTWDVTVIAAYQIRPADPLMGMAACGGTPDILSYEMVRVEQPRDPRTIIRPSDLPMAQRSGLCG